MPGANVFRVTFDKLDTNHALKLQLNYVKGGKTIRQTHVIGESPYYFSIDLPDFKLREVERYYDQEFGKEEVMMRSYSLRVVPRKGTAIGRSLSADQAEAAFSKACPHPYVAVNRLNQKIIKDARREQHPRQTSGFLPQSVERREPDDRMKELIKQVRDEVSRNGGHSPRVWVACQELGNYPAAVDFLIEILPRTQIDMTIYACKALAQIGDKKAIPALLAKWKKHGQRGAPGTRYIPDALVACGAGPQVVPALVAPLKTMRFDFRFHVAHALGKIGGPGAVTTLEDLAEGDPFAAVRAEAKRGLRQLRTR
jgi:hypothetical protein